MRKSILFAPASFVEGWAHYCEQMMVEAGFGRDDYGVKLGQLAEALDPPRPLHRRASSCTPRTCRSSRESASSATRRSWKKPSARREAERGTFDPTYLVYSAGKLMLLKLRNDYKQQQGKAFSLRSLSRHAARTTAPRPSGSIAS